MKLSLNWLSEYVDLTLDPDSLSSLLTMAGVEVEGVTRSGADFPHVVVAQILSSDPHPDADRLSVCRVDDGSGTPRQIVCGAKNYKVGDKIPLALPGAVLPGDFKIKKGKLRGVESEGMMCSAKELQLAADADGLLILPTEFLVWARPLRSCSPRTPCLTSRSHPTVRTSSAMSGLPANFRPHRSPARAARARPQSRLRFGPDAGDDLRLRPLPALLRPTHPGCAGRPQPGVAGPPPGIRGPAPHQQHRRCHQLRPAGNRAAAACLRCRHPARRY